MRQEFIRTRYPALDKILGGGLARGRLIEIRAASTNRCDCLAARTLFAALASDLMARPTEWGWEAIDAQAALTRGHVSVRMPAPTPSPRDVTRGCKGLCARAHTNSRIALVAASSEDQMNGLRFYASVRMQVRFDAVHQLAVVRCVKNKLAQPFQVARFELGRAA